jgi:transcription termination factor NusB
MTKWRREKTHMNKVRDEKGDITMNTKKIQKITTEYFKNLYSSKLENLEEMDKFLDAYIKPKLNQEGMSYLNRPIICNEIETIIESPYKEEPRT